MNTYTIPSPCVGICKLNDESTSCTGCYRTLAEIRAWPKMTNQERLDTLETLKTRRQTLGNIAPRIRKNKRRNADNLRKKNYDNI